MAEQIDEHDLHAYVDGALDEARAVEVERYLREHPEVGRRVSEYMAQAEALRDDVLAPRWTPSVLTTILADRLARRLRWLRMRNRIGGGVLAACAVAVGWLAHSLVVSPGADLVPTHPAFVEEAAEAHTTAELLAMSFGEMTEFEAGEIEDVMHRITGKRISLDGITEQWPVAAALVVPWDEGTAIELIQITQDGEIVTLFVAVPQDSAEVQLSAARMDDVNLAYWQRNRIAFALGGNLPHDELLEIASRLSDARL